MIELYECKSCGVLSVESADLCRPQEAERACAYEYHGAPLAALCPPARSLVVECCAACGRPALSEGFLCLPRRSDEW